MACEENGGGFSDVPNGGSVLRYNLIDGAQTWVEIDYPLHAAGDFDTITNHWMHVTLVAEYDSVKTYVDGVLVPDSEYGTYLNARNDKNAAYDPKNAHALTPSALTQPLRTFNLNSDIILGGRADFDHNRMFKGSMALVQVWSTALTEQFVKCVFTSGEMTLPAPAKTLCHAKGKKPDLDALFLGDAVDISTNHHTIKLEGATTGPMGLKFDGQGDYAAIMTFDYAVDGVFSISFWMTKEACTQASFEYLYSHQASQAGNILDGKMSNINIYLGCEENGGAYSDAKGSVVRYNVVDDAGSHATFDFPLHAAGDFDALTNAWVNLVLVVNKNSIKTYEDGILIPDKDYYFFGAKATNVAHPKPSLLTKPLGAFSLKTDIIIGGRADLNPYRHFVGHIAGLEISTQAFDDADVKCTFSSGEEKLPTMLEMCEATRKAELSVTFLNDITDSAGSPAKNVHLMGSPIVSSSGVEFKHAGDYVKVDNFDYADDATFTVSFWMTKQVCTDNTFEYVYSHGNIVGDESNVNYYWGCEKNGAGFSTHTGSVLRLNYLSKNKTHATADIPMHNASNFDSITNKWIHLVTVVTPTSLQTFLDGVAVTDGTKGSVNMYHFHQGAQNTGSTVNVAHPTPSKFRFSLESFDLKTDIFIGDRSDAKKGSQTYRQFKGSIALLRIWTKALHPEAAHCVFSQGDAQLPEKWSPGNTTVHITTTTHN